MDVHVHSHVSVAIKKVKGVRKMDGYNGIRRRRNIKLSWDQEEPLESVYKNPGWDNDEPKLEEDYEDVEQYEEDKEIDEDDSYEENRESNTFLIDGKPFVPKQRSKKESFMDTHDRYTTYLEKNLLHIIRMLQENGQIESITKFINASIKEHLMNNYHNEK